MSRRPLSTRIGAVLLGSMLASSRPYIGQAEHLVLLPGLCIAMTLLGVNLLGDALRDRLDPRMAGGR